MEDSPRAVRLKIINDAHCYRTDQYVAKISTLRTFCAGGSGAGPCLGDTGYYCVRFLMISKWLLTFIS